MFSGIIGELGTVVASDIAGHGRLRLAAERSAAGMREGDSLAVNGCCLTVVSAGEGAVEAEVMPETARRTTLAELRPGDPVNLEPALALGDVVGGHLVTGHVDAVGTVTQSRGEGNARRVTVSLDAELAELAAPRGSVALDGISLTVVEAGRDTVTVSLIPHTLAVTTAGRWEVGTRVNVEADMLSRYARRAIEALLESRRPAVDAAGAARS